MFLVSAYLTLIFEERFIGSLFNGFTFIVGKIGQPYLWMFYVGLHVISPIFLLVVAHKNWKPKMLIPWLVVNAVWIPTGIGLYFWLVVYSYFIELSEMN
jgi:hypothetical protein